MKKKRHIFIPGDRASFGGARGTCEESGVSEFPILFRDDTEPHRWCFTIDGKWCDHQTEPLLKYLVMKGKKRKKKLKTEVPTDLIPNPFRSDIVLRINFILNWIREREERG